MHILSFEHQTLDKTYQPVSLTVHILSFEHQTLDEACEPVLLTVHILCHSKLFEVLLVRPLVNDPARPLLNDNLH